MKHNNHKGMLRRKLLIQNMGDLSRCRDRQAQRGDFSYFEESPHFVVAPSSEPGQTCIFPTNLTKASFDFKANFRLLFSGLALFVSVTKQWKMPFYFPPRN